MKIRFSNIERVPSFCDAISIHAEFILPEHVLLQIFLVQ